MNWSEYDTHVRCVRQSCCSDWHGSISNELADGQCIVLSVDYTEAFFVYTNLIHKLTIVCPIDSKYVNTLIQWLLKMGAITSTHYAICSLSLCTCLSNAHLKHSEASGGEDNPSIQRNNVYNLCSRGTLFNVTTNKPQLSQINAFWISKERITNIAGYISSLVLLIIMLPRQLPYPISSYYYHSQHYSMLRCVPIVLPLHGGSHDIIRVKVKGRGGYAKVRPMK